MISSFQVAAAPPGYSFYKKLTTQAGQITAGTGNLPDFPVLVNVTDPDLRHTSNGGFVEHISGYDFIFTSSDGNTVIPHQVEKYNPATGELVAWVKVPLVSATVNTDFFIYFGNNAIVTDPSTSSTWNAGFVGVWHLHNDENDATVNGLNLTNNGPTVNQSPAVAADGQDFTFTQSLSHASNAQLQINGDITLETWVSFSSALQAAATENVLFASGLNSEAFNTNYNYSLNYVGAGGNINHLRFYWEHTLGIDVNVFSTAPFPPGTNTWHHVAAVRDNTNLQVIFYVDGIQLGAPVAYTIGPNLGGLTTFQIGRDQAAPARDLDADLDEPRISNVVRTPEWIQATYLNTKPGSTFLVYGPTQCVFSDVADAGTDQDVCVNSATLAGNSLTYGTGQWTVLSGTGTITTPASPSSTVNGLSVGNNAFIWTVTNSPFPPCVSFSDTVNIVFDNTPPTVICPTNQNVFVNAACAFVLPDYTGLAVTSDNCGAGGVTVTQLPVSGTVISTGTTVVHLYATDANGNTDSCSFSVIAADNIAPVFTFCPANISVNNDPGNCDALVSWVAPTATDNCPGVTITQTSGPASGAAFPVGTTTVVFTAEDASGNGTTCSFDVTVMDTENPVFTFCPSNITTANDPGICGAVVTWVAPVATDNCPSPTITQLSGPASGSVFPAGTTTITYEVIDGNGNTDNCSFNVTVNDTEAPVFTSCPGNIAVGTDPGICTAVVSWAAPTVTDNCAGPVTLTQTTGPASGSVFNEGTVTVITYEAADPDGNISTCSFTVTVSDNEAPVFSSCPGNITISNDPGSCDAVVSWAAPVATDNCSAVTLTQTSGPVSGSVFPTGTTNVSFTATDASGNNSVCAFTVTVVDNELPVFTGCPGNISVSNDPGLCTAVVSWAAPVASDNCPGVVLTQTAGAASGSAFPVGVTTVTFTATDASSNISSCTFTVTVTETEVPVFTSCPANISVGTDPGNCDAVVSWAAPAASDNCPGVTVTQTTGPASGSAFPAGTTTVTFQANDANGNSATCSFDVTVTDNEAPVFTSCPGNIAVGNDAGVCGAVVSWAAPVVSDNCTAVVTPVQTTGPASGSLFPVGTTNISYTATDADGNSSVCSFSVTVTDNELPVFTFCPGDITVGNDPGVCSAVVTWAPPVASDNCPGITITQITGPPSGSIFPVGVTAIAYTVTDASGNSELCEFTVTVVDNEAPVFTFCPANVNVTAAPGFCSATASWPSPAVSDNCAGVSFVQTIGPASGSVFPMGTTLISYTATDLAGNTAVCSFTVTISEFQPPVFTTCPVNVAVNNDPGTCGAVVTWAAPTATDNCPGVIVTQTSGLVSGSTFPIGTTNVSFTATDASGNTATCSFSVTVTDNQLPVFTTCPTNIAVNNDPGACSAVVSWATPMAADNCPGTVITQTAGLPSGSAFPIGTTFISFTATDASGNTATCSFNVTVTDNQTPAFTFCPSNITVNSVAGLCSAPVSWIAPSASDNCPGVGVSQTTGLVSGSSFPVGVTNVSFTATDASGNTSVCAFTVTVTDNQLPVFTSCPVNITVNNDPGNCTAVVSWVAPAASDNCAGTVITQTAGLPSGSAFPIGTTNISYTATDASGNTSVCAFTVTVTDNQLPVFTSCPGNINVTNTAGSCGAIVSWPPPAASDNCPGTVITQTTGPASGSLFPVGATNVSFTATDAGGNTAVCSFIVTVVDNQSPVFTFCPGNISVNSTAGLCSAPVSWITPSASDNCPGVSVSQTSGLVSGSSFPVGVTNVSFTATDASGNTSICAFTVTVTDNQPPVFTSCPVNITVNSDPGNCSAVVNWTAPAASDNCAGVVLTQTSGLPSGSAFPIGTTNIVFTATDASGNAATCSFTVTVTDNQLPVFTSCPANISLNNTPGQCGATVSWVAPAASDNCPGTVITQTTGPASGSLFPIGTTNISFTATDASGNTATCSFTVTVTDNTGPVFTSCPANISVNNSAGTCGAVVSWAAPVATDNCPGVSVVQITGLPSGSTFPVGTTNISYTATDASGNTATCSFTVTVIDNQNPVFVTCPSNISVNNTPGLCGAIVSWVAPTASDNCPGYIVSQVSGPASGSLFPVGLTPVAYSVTDASGNTNVCSFTVTVTDNESPTFTFCPGNIVVNNASGLCSAVVTWAAPVAADNCPGVSVIQTTGPVSGSTFPVGTTNISYTATDAYGHTSICAFTVTVVDAELPVFTLCPVNISVNTDPGLCSAVVSWPAPLVTDNCPGVALAQTGGLASGSAFPPGVTTITYTATDAGGNTAVCTFNVTVTDNQVPVFTSCPANISVGNDPGVCGAVVTWALPVVTDNCPGVVLTQTSGLASGSTFPIGVTNISYTATDPNGNSATCSFTVTVTDTEAPVFTTCPVNISANNDPGTCSAVVTWVAPAASDNCPGVSVVQTLGPPSGSVFAIGVTNISYTATDVNGNTSVCAFSVTVTDNELPVFTSCPANIVVSNTPGLCSATVNWAAPTVSDNCPGVTLTQTAGLPNGSAFPIGTTNIVFTATDVYGNTSTCTFTVTVNDNELPVFTSCPGNISVNTVPGLCSANVSWVAPAATDNCAGMVITQTAGLPSGSAFPTGVTTVSYTATDASGNTATCTFAVTVTDNQPPVFSSCPTNISVNNDAGNCSAVVSWAAPVASDNCPGMVITQTSGLPSGSVFPIGVTNVAFTATDANGNNSVCAFTVTVTDNEVPVFTSCPANISANNNAGTCGAVVSWATPVAVDNCPGLIVTQTAGLPSGSVFPIGTTNISFLATDANGNTATCSFTVTVSDIEAPVFTSCPPNISVSNDPGNCTAVVTWPAPVATDNCPGVTIVQTSGPVSGSAFPIGVTSVSFTASDNYGNTAVCSFNVTVTDNQFPVFTSCPTNISVNNTPGSCSAVVTWVAPVATDNCAGMTLTQTAGLPSGSAFPIGTTNVVFTATDASGNISTCSFTVTVTDNQVPTFTACPGNISTNNTPGTCGAVVFWAAPTATDNCPGTVITQTSGLPSGSTFPIGVTNVAFTATDASGNSATCSFTVTVTDNEVPVFTSCPVNVTTSNTASVCGAVVSWAAPTATDNCPGLSITQTSGLPSGSTFPVGITTVTFTATDASGNSAICSFSVTITDNENPVFTSCPSNISVNTGAGLCSAIVSWISPTATDNCPGLVVTQTAGPVSGSAFPIGVTNVSFTATDASGNTSICAFTVTVTDNQFPVFSSCPSNVSVTNTPGLCSAVVSWTPPAASDNCAGMTLTQTAGLPSGSAFPIGTSNIVYTATDASGNATLCSFTVTVTDNEVPVFTSCPSNIVLNNSPGLCSAIASWTTPVATDNCPGTVISQTSGLPNGSSFPIGVTTVTYQVADASGNTAPCSFTVTVNDNELPVFTSCPANISVNTDPGICGATVSWVAPTVSDNCPGSVLTQTLGPPSGSVFPLGTTNISYLVTDAVGNSATCAFTVTVTDNQAPVFSSCPVNINLTSTPGLCSAVATWAPPAANDNCPGLVTITQTAGLASGSAFPVGVTLVTFTATDAYGNSSNCSFNVTVTDNVLPVFTSCPGNIAVGNTAGICGAVVSWPAPAASDNCPGVVVTQTAGLPSGSTFPLGVTNVSFNALDASGNSATCSFTVTVTDTEFPVFTSCPGNINVNNNPGLCSAVVSWVAPAATDNCPGVTIIQTAGLVSGSAFPIGVTTVTYAATDAAGNISICSFNVTVADNQFPVFSSCPGNITVNNDPGNCSAVVTWIAPAASDNCPGMTLAQTTGFAPGSTFPVGVSNIVYTATDAYGNSTLCSFTVTVVDNQAPVFTSCPGNISVNNNAGMCSAVVSWTVPAATDNCTSPVTLVQTAGPPSGSAFPIGVTNISYNAIDAAGNISVCAFTVTVTDNQFPVFSSCPANITVNNTPGNCDAVVSWTAPVAADNCPGLVVTQTSGLVSGSSFPVGVTNVSFSAVDASGNTAVCSFTVTVVDNQLPVFTSCPGNVNVINNPGLCGAVVSWIAPTATDNCAGTVISQTAGLPSGSLFPVGTTNVSFSATDASGNTSLCAFTVTVTDNELPVFVSCPGNIAVNNNSGLCSAVVTWAAPVASDNCAGVTVLQTAGPANGSAFPLGITNVTYTATDAAGNMAICSFTVTVNDAESPVFTSCPGNISVNNNPGMCSAVVSWTAPAASDNCTGGVTISQTAGLPSGSAFPVGTTVVSFSATDAAGNTSICTFTVTVTDNQFPVFSSCPGNINVNSTPGMCSAVVSWIAPAASDNCAGMTLVQTTGPVSGSSFPIGVTNVAYTATDAAGNVSTCAFTVTVTDNQAPVFASCPANIVVNNDPGNCSAVVSWPAPVATDNCPGTVTAQTLGLPSGSAFPIGVTNVSFTATDASGNNSVCAFTVTVIDNQAPVFSSCPVNIAVANDPGNCSAVVSWPAPVVSDNCPGVVLTQTSGLPSGSTFPTGTTNISFLATDASGLTATCSFSVTVTDNQAPVFASCPGNINVNNTPGLCGATVSWSPPTATDNCPGIVTITQTAGLPSGSTFPIGVTLISYTATDALGNTSVCSFNITVADNELPVISGCPANITLNALAGTCGAPAAWAAPTATDNCPGVSIIQASGLPSGSVFPTGISTVTYTATDAAGNTANCTFTVTVIDNQFPVFVTCPANINLNNNPGICGAVANWPVPTATDNCPGVVITQTAGLPNGAVFPIGTTTVNYSATDASGNSSVCSFTVTVTDIEAPVFSACPANISVNNGPGICGAVVTWPAPAATDNCPGVSILQTLGPASGSLFPIGTTNISFTATDASGNSAVCSFSVTVTDNEMPVFSSCPANIVTGNTPGSCSAVVNWAVPAATDNCPGVAVIQTSGLPSGSTFPLGTTNVVYTAADANGNIAICSFTVTVNDNEAPVFTSCPANINVNNTPGTCGAVVSWVAPAATDNCGGAGVVQTAGPASGSIFPTGTTNITFTATDGAGNSSLCSFTVTVTDNEVPVFTSCPVNISVVNDPGTCGAVVSWVAPAATDNCPGMNLVQTGGLPSGSVFPIGVTNIVFTATDAGGNATTCNFSVTVTDNENPVFTSCPSNISTCNPVVVFAAPVATDNCAGTVINLTGGLASGSTFPAGNTNVQFTATDASGNTAICQFVVTVLPPVTSQFVAAAPDTMCVLDADINMIPFVVANAGATDSFAISAGGVIPVNWTFSPSSSGVGLYTLTHYVSNAGCSDSSTHTIQVVPVANATWIGPDTLCESLGSQSLNTYVVSNPGGYFIGTNVTSNTLNLAGLGGTTVNIGYVLGFGQCKDTSFWNIYVSPDVDPTWAFVLDTICSSNGIINLGTLVSGTPGGTWSGPGVTGNIFDPSLLNGIVNITYTVGESFCAESLTLPINIIVQPVTFAGNDTVVCGLTDTLHATAFIGNGTWSSPSAGIGFANVNNPNTVVTSSSEGTFMLIWSESIGGTCFADDTVMVTFWEIPVADAGPDQSIDVTTSVFSGATPPFGIGVWTSQGPGPVITLPNSPTSGVNNLTVGDNVFTWTVTNGTCPAATDDMIITVNDVIIPAGISPNGDGMNDVWVIGGISSLPNELTIFNRWGQELYHVVNYQNDWAGTKQNGDELPNDTYFYILKVSGYEDFTGYIIIRR